LLAFAIFVGRLCEWGHGTQRFFKPYSDVKVFIDRFRTKHDPPPSEAGTISLRTASVEEIWSTWRYEKPDTQPNTVHVEPFASEELCNKAADAIRAEINAPIASQRAQTLGRVVCFARKDK
jgi:hypothetical protein